MRPHRRGDAPAGVPYAVDGEGRVVHVRAAERDVMYACLGCGGLLSLTRGPGRSAERFTHVQAGGLFAQAGACDGPVVARRAAARLLASAWAREVRVSGEVSWREACPGVGGRCRSGVVRRRALAVGAEAGVALDASGAGGRWDVAVTVEGRVVLGVRLTGESEGGEGPAEGVRMLMLEPEDVLAFWPVVPQEPERCAACDLEAKMGERGAELSAARLVRGAWAQVLTLVDAGVQAEERPAPAVEAPRPRSQEGVTVCRLGLSAEERVPVLLWVAPPRRGRPRGSRPNAPADLSR